MAQSHPLKFSVSRIRRVNIFLVKPAGPGNRWQIDFRMLEYELSKYGPVLSFQSRVSSDKIQAAGYKFQYPGIQEALKNLVQ